MKFVSIKILTRRRTDLKCFIIIGLLIVFLYYFADNHIITSIFNHSISNISSVKTKYSTRWTNIVEQSRIPFESNYPRPNLRRKLWMNLNGYWSFAITSINEVYPKRFDRSIRVPFPVESYLSDVQERVDSGIYLWYKTKLEIKTRTWYNGNDRLILHFDKVDYETVVYLNNNTVGSKHLGGYEPFSYDITPYFLNYKENELVVRVWDPTNEGYQPRGKQLLQGKKKSIIFYTPCSGIWGTVWLERVPIIHIDRIQFQTELSANDVILKYRIDLKSFFNDNSTKNSFREERKYLLYAKREQTLILKNIDYEKLGFTVKINIIKKDDEDLIDFTSRKTNIDQEISLPLNKIQLWSPENPYLYRVSIDLYKHNTFIEHVDSYVGFRKISLCSTTNKICLNNKPYFMIGVLDQGYWPDGLYRAPTDDAYQFDIRQMKNLGFNTIRKHMKVETARWYYWCDVIGMLVWQDMPSADSFKGYQTELDIQKQLQQLHSNNRDYLEVAAKPESSTHKKAFDAKIQFEYELKGMIDFLSFHPSIVIWVLFNEAWGQYDTIRLALWLQSYDKYRLIDSVSGWHDRIGIGHIKDIHDYSKSILLPNLDYETRAIVLGEYGGLGLTKSGWSYHRYTDQYLMTYAFEQLFINLHPSISAVIYTQLSDVENEYNGIFTYNRDEIKFPEEHIKRLFQRNYSRIYRLKHIWNLTSIPYTNYEELSFSKTLEFSMKNYLSNEVHFYFYIHHLYSQVDIKLDDHHHIHLNQTNAIKNYYYISLPSNLFSNHKHQQHSIDIHVQYMPSTDVEKDLSSAHINRACFYFNFVIIYS